MNDIAEAALATAASSEPEHAPHAGPGGRSPADGRGDVRSRTDTRARIQQVAVELFTEHGYEGTSLREIAERLDVTKAALYYHFRSKEDIIRSLVEDYRGQMDDLINWALSQPRTPESRREILTRYMGVVAERSQVFRMLHQNQAVLNTMASVIQSLKTSPVVLADLLTEPGAPLRERVRATMAIGGISVGWMSLADQVPDRQELSEIVCSLAAEFTHCQAPAPQGAPARPGGPS